MNLSLARRLVRVAAALSTELQVSADDEPAMTAPTLAEIAEKLRSLVTDFADRRDVSRWASHRLVADHPGIDHDVVWRALERLGAADPKGGETEFVYYDVDFHAWLMRSRMRVRLR